MKDIITKICEGKPNITRTPEFTKTYALINALKDWYNYGVEHARKNDGTHSPYIKEFTKGTEDFIRNTIMAGLEYMGDGTTNEIIDSYLLDATYEDGFDKIENELVKYVLNKK